MKLLQIKNGEIEKKGKKKEININKKKKKKVNNNIKE